MAALKKYCLTKKCRVGKKQIVVPSENDIFEISKELDPISGPKFLIGWNESV